MSREERDKRILDIVKSQTNDGCPVATKDVIELAWQNGRGLTYDQTNSVLARLVREGRLEKPTRGNYLLTVVF